MLRERCRLSTRTIEIKLKKPSAFEFQPGQRICLVFNDVERDYSLASAPADPDLILCIRVVRGGILSSILGSAPIGTAFDFTGPHGYFTFRPSARPAVFAATGTGVAPFVSMVRTGITGYTLLHGVDTAADLYYASLLRPAARSYVPCLSEIDASSAAGYHFPGRVTDYLQKKLAPGRYDFYLSGRREMIRDVTWIVDDRFQGSRIYSEVFY